MDILKIKKLDKDDLKRISEVCLTSLACLLMDQQNNREWKDSLGSWGRSTIDYCFLATRDFNWDIKKGSITQTAWALQALSECNDSYLPDAIIKAIHTARKNSAPYVKTRLEELLLKESDIVRVRHNATSVLAYECLPKEAKDLDTYDNVALYYKHFRTIDYAFKDWQKQEYLVSVDVAIIAAYASAVLSIISSTSNDSQDYITEGEMEFRSTLEIKLKRHKIFENFIAIITEFAKSGVDVGTYGEKRVLSPFLQYAMFLHVAALVRSKNPQYEGSVLLTEAAVSLCRELVKSIEGVLNNNYIDVNNMGIIDPWTLICCSIAGLNFEDMLKRDENDKLRAVLHHGLRSWNSKNTSLFCTTIHWSILVQYLRSVLSKFGTTMASYNLGSGNSYLLRRMPWLNYFPDFVKKYLEAVWTEKFGIFEDKGSEIWGNSMRNRIIIQSLLKKKISNQIMSSNEYTEHVNQFFPNYTLSLRPEIRRVHVLLAGYSTSGKSTVCDFLRSETPIVYVMKRATTRPGPYGTIDGQSCSRVDIDDFNNMCENGEIVACHELWGDQYGFYASELDNVPYGKLIMYQVGWSMDAINSLRSEIKRRFAREPHFILLLELPDEELRKRLKSLRGFQKRPKELEDEMEVAKHFYEEMSSVYDNIKSIDTSLNIEDTIHLCLAELEDFLEVSEGVESSRLRDVFLSHASTDKQSVVIPLAETLKNLGISVWLDDDEMILGNTIEVIQEGIKNSKIIVLFFSEAFFKSKWAQAEYRIAVKRNIELEKTVIPILLGVDAATLGETAPYINTLIHKTIKPYDPTSRVSESDLEELAFKIETILKKLE